MFQSLTFRVDFGRKLDLFVTLRGGEGGEMVKTKKIIVDSTQINQEK